MDQVQPTMPYWFRVLPTMLFVFGVLGLLAWNRWLSYKEAMKAAELGGNSRVALGLRERWRVRHGVLWAVRVLALGAALGVVGMYADKLETLLGRRVLEAEHMLLLVGAVVCLVLIGAVTLIAYVVWSRRDVEVLALGLLGDERKIAPEAGGDDEEQSGAGEETEGETRG